MALVLARANIALIHQKELCRAANVPARRNSFHKSPSSCCSFIVNLSARVPFKKLQRISCKSGKQFCSDTSNSRQSTHRTKLSQHLFSPLPPNSHSRKPSSLLVAQANSSGGEGDGTGEQRDLDFAIFRFTLGIPGFDDSDLPRVLGISFGILLALNHIASPHPVLDAQLRAEAVGLLLAAVAIVLPAIGRRLKGGRSAAAVAASASGGGAQIFAIAEDLSEVQRQEIAWASYALLRNTPTSSMVAVRLASVAQMLWTGGEVLCARGRWQLPESTGGAVEDAQRRALLSMLSAQTGRAVEQSAALQGLVRGPQGVDSLYIPTSAGLGDWELLPCEKSSMVVHSFDLSQGNDRGLLVLVSGASRAYSAKDRTWVSAMAEKLASALKPELLSV
eukprot:jgi/Mesen1/4693/ME000241S03737